MFNTRAVENPALDQARREVLAVYEKYGFVGAFEIISPEEAAFAYPITADWSAIKKDVATPMGLQLQARRGDPRQHELLENAAHTLCQLMDFGAQTYKWCGDMVKLLQQSGLQIEHTPFGGNRLGDIQGLD